jgi:hypothetical protein
MKRNHRLHRLHRLAKRGWHPLFSIIYWCRNTQMPEGKFWNENKVLQDNLIHYLKNQ